MLQRAFDRQRSSVTQNITFPAPTAGWVQSGNVVTARKDQAEVLDNFIVTSQGARLRGGITETDDAGAAVTRLFTYKSGTETMFAATAGNIYDATDVAGGSLRVVTSGDFSTTQISTAGGEFLVGVNGADTGFSYNGTTFSDLALTGVSEDALDQVWLFKERLFFVEGGTQSAWYLPVESIGGTATEINLGSVFAKGGVLLFGATWSLDSGSGLDDVCIFVSDQGEVAVYEGTDPASASTWSLVGVYEIGKPLNKHGWFRAGGDLAILTEDGIIPISEALRKDRAALQASALTFPIEDAWKDAIANRTASYPISATLWQSGTLLLVGTPATENGVQVSFAANARTGGWSRILGWDVRCSAVYNDELYFADNAGKIYKADTGGTDAGTAYSGYYVPKFQDTDRLNSTVSASVTYRAPAQLTFNLYAHADYQVDAMAVPVPSTTESGAAWGTFVWGTDVWGGSTGENTYVDTQFVRASGYSVAPGLTITSNQSEMIDVKLLSTRLRIESGYAL